MRSVPPDMVFNIRITVKNLMTSPPSTIRMEVSSDTTVAEILWSAQDMWRFNLAAVCLKLGRWLLDPEWTVKDMGFPVDGTVLELIPHPGFDGDIRRVL